MTKSLAHRLYLKQQLYSIQMVENKFLVEQMTELYNIIDDIENIEVSIDDGEKDILLLRSLPRSI